MTKPESMSITVHCAPDEHGVSSFTTTWHDGEQAWAQVFRANLDTLVNHRRRQGRSVVITHGCEVIALDPLAPRRDKGGD